MGLRQYLRRRAIVCALALAAGTAELSRAEAPLNPLRAPIAATASLRLFELESAATRAEPALATSVLRPDVALSGRSVDDTPDDSAPPSVVPPNLGQPELLPPPLGLAIPSGAGFEAAVGDDAQWQHFVHPWFDEPWFSHSDPNDPHRHHGIGQPLVGTSWRNRPLFVGWFVGGVMLNDLVPNRIYQNDTAFLGARLGFDFDHYWGLESRWAFAHPELTMGDGTPLPDPSRDYFAAVSLAYYPFGDTRWRPYLSVGMGFQTFRFNNDLGQRISEAVFELPLGFGVKYYYGPWFTLRFDFADNLALGNARVSGMHNVSLMTGAEFRFGGRRPSYFPWHNGTAYW